MFYDRFPSNLFLQQERLNGSTENQYLVTKPAFFDPSNTVLPSDAKILIRLVNRLGSGRGCLKIRIGGQHGIAGIEEGGFRDEILVLCRAVQSLLLQEEVGRKE